MATYPYKWNIFERDLKQYTINQLSENLYLLAAAILNRLHSEEVESKFSVTLHYQENPSIILGWKDMDTLLL
jgi:hypothetical protein